MRWAIIESDIVQNVIIWDGVSVVFPFDMNQLIQLNENEPCEIGYGFDPNGDPRFTPSVNSESI